MQGGRLRHKIEIWKYDEVVDDYGEPLKQYSKIADSWAEIRPLTGREGFYDKMEVTEQTHKILTRYIYLPIDATMQIRYNNRKFEVIGAPINVLERNVQLQFNVKEVFEHDVAQP